MNLRNIIPRPSQGATPSDVSQYAVYIVAALLFLFAGFGIVKFLLNFDQLQRLEEENSSSRAVEAATSKNLSGAEMVPPETASALAAMEPAGATAWLASVNRYRAMVGVAPVTADDQLSHGDFLHSHYLALNYAAEGRSLSIGAEAHTEGEDQIGFTSEGAAAARASDVDWSWDPHRRPKLSWAIGNWMAVPFHRMQIINPYLRKVGYGMDCRGAICFAALNTGTDVDPPPAIPSSWSRPLIFPPDGSVMDTGEFSGEWPDPLTSCPGYTSPAGLPITLELGHLIVPSFSDYSIKAADVNRTPLEACAFDANSYVNPDAAAQTIARAILKDFGAIVIVPRHPLLSGRYVVTLSAGQTYSWSFSVVPRNHE
jgi:hypothetical protein